MTDDGIRVHPSRGRRCGETSANEEPIFPTGLSLWSENPFGGPHGTGGFRRVQDAGHGSIRFMKAHAVIRSPNSGAVPCGIQVAFGCLQSLKVGLVNGGGNDPCCRVGNPDGCVHGVHEIMPYVETSSNAVAQEKELPLRQLLFTHSCRQRFN